MLKGSSHKPALQGLHLQTEVIHKPNFKHRPTKAKKASVKIILNHTVGEMICIALRNCGTATHNYSKTLGLAKDIQFRGMMIVILRTD